MKKYTLSLTLNSSSERELYLVNSYESLPVSENHQRTSPVYLTNKQDLQPSDFKTGKLLIIYSLDTLFLIGRINHYYSKKTDNVYVFQTLGIGSILVYSQNKDIPFELLVKELGDSYWGIEAWTIQDNILSNPSKEINKLKQADRLNIDFSLLDYEDKIILNEIIPSLSFLESFTKCYLPQYTDFSIELKKTILDLYYRLLLLTKKITECDFEKQSILLFGTSEIAKKVVKSYATFIDPKICIIRHHQLRDELMQISAILRTINTQAFYGLDCLETGYTRTGNNSLFGTGLAYAGVFTLYAHMRELFIKTISLNKIKEDYSKFGSPAFLQNPSATKKWRANLKSINKNLDILDIEENKSGSFYHLIYYSNRLGFRETKRSISAAQQSMYLGILPPWSLNTLTHEFIHAHVRGLLSIVYPININDEKLVSSSLYQVYENRLDKANICGSLLDFIKVSFLNVAHGLRNVEINIGIGSKGESKKVYDLDTLSSILKQYYHEIDEIIVHILDFHYFYSASPDIYVKSIWSSWLSLPFTLSRIPEYLIRTVVAVASEDIDADRNQLEYAIDTIEKELVNLKEYNFVDQEQLNMVLEEFNNPNFRLKLNEEYFEIWRQLTDIVMIFLYSNKLKDSLNIDFFEEFSENNSLIKEGEYKEFRIESPITFMNSLMWDCFNKKKNVEIKINDIEAGTAWMLSIINSRLFNK